MRRFASPIALAAIVAGLATLAPATARVAPSREVRLARDGHARIPFDLRGGHVWVRGTINGSDSLWIIVDTGASASVMDDAVAQSLGLESRGTQTAFGAGGPQRGSVVGDVTIGLQGLTLHRERLSAVGLGALSRQGGRPMALVLGHELFAACVVRFDYGAGVLDVWEPARAPVPAPGTAVPMTLTNNHPYVEAELAVSGRPPMRGRFVIDTGSGASLIVAPDVVRRNRLEQAFPRTLETVGRGVGGEIRQRVARADSFRVGGLRFDRPLVMLPQPAGHFSAPGTLGNIGGMLLSRCRVTFDYPGRRVVFEAAKDFEEPFEADMSGVTLRPGDSGWSVRVVNPETPASRAGLRVGDRVTALNGQAIERVDPASIRRLLQEEGKTVTIGIRRGEEESVVSLVLERLL